MARYCVSYCLVLLIPIRFLMLWYYTYNLNDSYENYISLSILFQNPLRIGSTGSCSFWFSNYLVNLTIIFTNALQQRCQGCIYEHYERIFFHLLCVGMSDK